MYPGSWLSMGGNTGTSSNSGAASWNGLTTFTFVNGTQGKWADNQVYWAIIGKDFHTKNFVHVNLNGDFIPMQLSDNGALIKNGQDYSNYFFSLADVQSITIPAIDSARVLLSVGTPMYIQINTDDKGNIAYAGANVENPSDPNIDVYFDFVEMAIYPQGTSSQGIFINTTRVDQFGFPIKLRLQGIGGYDQTVGEPLTESRDTLFSEFIAEVPSEFTGLAQTPYALYRIVAPAHASFRDHEVNANYFQSYIDTIWSEYSRKELVFTLPGLGTFTGRVTGDVFQFVGGVKNGTYFINGKPSTPMVLLGNGLLSDPSRASDADVDTQLQIQAQICAAINRHIVEDPANWCNSDMFYQSGQAANYYAKFWHDHSIKNLAYGFAYDDVGGFSPSLHTAAPTNVTITIGW